MATSKDDRLKASPGPVSHLIVRVARLHQELAGRLLRGIGLYPGQELLLMQLWDGGPQRQVDVMRVLGSDAATMTRSVRRLERAGLVSRTRNAEDGRSVIITATPHSETLRARVSGVWSVLEAATVGEMSATEQALVIEALEGLESCLAA